MRSTHVRLGNAVLGVTAAATQPIFHGGTLFHREPRRQGHLRPGRRDIAARSAWWRSRKNVADALTALRTDADAQLQKAQVAERAAERKPRDHAQAPRARRHQLSEPAQRAADLSAGADQLPPRRRPIALPTTAALLQALGGGWWNRDDPEPQLQADRRGAVFQMSPGRQSAANTAADPEIGRTGGRPGGARNS